MSQSLEPTWVILEDGGKWDLHLWISTRANEKKSFHVYKMRRRRRFSLSFACLFFAFLFQSRTRDSGVECGAQEKEIKFVCFHILPPSSSAHTEKFCWLWTFFFAPFSRCSLHQRKTNKTRHLLRCATDFAALCSSNNSNNIKNDDTAVTMIIMMVSRPESASNNQVEKQYEKQQKFWP